MSWPLRVNAHEIGHKAVSQLAWRIAHQSKPHTETILLEPTLVGGTSVRQQPGPTGRRTRV